MPGCCQTLGLRWYFLYKLLGKHTKYVSTRLEKVLSLIMFLFTINAKTDSFSVWTKQHSLHPISPSPDLSHIVSGILLQSINYSFGSSSYMRTSYSHQRSLSSTPAWFYRISGAHPLAATELRLRIICVVLQFLFNKCGVIIQFAWFELNMQTEELHIKVCPMFIKS